MNKNGKHLSDFIKIFPNVIDKKTINLLLKEYADCDDWVQATTVDGENLKIRNCDNINISNKNVIDKNKLLRTNIDKEIFFVTTKTIKKYCGAVGLNQNLVDYGYNLLRYKTGDFYKKHIDHYHQTPRLLSCSLALNDNYEGGEFHFFDKQISFKIMAGSAIVFPSNFMYPHEISEITKGTRYSIVTWFS